MLEKNLYLSSVDLANKQLLASVYNLPSIKAISLSFNLNSFFSSSIEKNSENSNYIKSVFFVYFITTVFPKISILKSTNLIKIEKNFMLNIILTNQIDINNFLDILFVDLFYNKDLQKFKTYYAKKSFTLCIPFLEFIESQNTFFFDDFIVGKELDVKIDFLFSNNVDKLHLKQLPYFWLFD